MLFMAISTSLAAQTATSFSHTLSTSASSDSIWKIWTDVPNWPEWDTGLREACLKGPFEVGTRGRLQPDKGPRASFKIIAIEEGKSYGFETKIPFGKLGIIREMTEKEGIVFFTHRVYFTGLFKKFFAKKFGERYRKMLPEVMGTIKHIAES